MTQKLFEEPNLVKRYNGFTAVETLYLEVYEGEIFGLLEPNGVEKPLPY